MFCRSMCSKFFLKRSIFDFDLMILNFQVSKCPEEPKAVCLSNYCGGCNAIWLSPNGGLAKCHTNCKPKKCNEVQCLVNPCLVSLDR